MNLLLPGLAAAYLLTFARVGTLVMLMPGIGETVVAPRLRLAFALLVALVLFPFVRPLLPQQAGTGPALIGVLIGEIAVGLVLGLSVRAVLAALQTTGTIVAQQLGLAYAMTVDPTTSGQQATLGSFLTMLGITLVLAADLHHLAIAGIRDSYALMPPIGVPATGDAAAFAIRAVARGFALAVQIAAPFIAFGILFNLGLGVLSRLMPQMQVFFVATPASILIGMAVLLASLGVVMGVFVEDLGRWLGEIGRP
ncbi:flagellar biosynthetic protein FliR [Methylobacterium sp. 4-46]|uniref:flagellar biosynthetic protein FliR n=1 Tax=unclassified Methylobacterium TaxID=2615210 RepID=UPI000152D210|nr:MULTISPECIES: flagellar biosynthetic protein FliR [Methylobacterium]ACA19476.1 flagellar biosynthetic protein FliR [Methylobacterium sp. 4-46]WFT78675.1 flagellar biosynthetic protein FliR [Methylobacterium nodulans]